MNFNFNRSPSENLRISIVIFFATFLTCLAFPGLADTGAGLPQVASNATSVVRALFSYTTVVLLLAAFLIVAVFMWLANKPASQIIKVIVGGVIIGSADGIISYAMRVGGG